MYDIVVFIHSCIPRIANSIVNKINDVNCCLLAVLNFYYAWLDSVVTTDIV